MILLKEKRMLILILTMVLSVSFSLSQQQKKKIKVTPKKKYVRLLSPQLVDSFRTIVTSSCITPDVNPLELSIRQEMSEWLNVRYRRAGITKQGVDCSGFIKMVFMGALDIMLPRSALEQSNLGEHIKKDSLQFGDLIFFKTTGKRINHAGIYIGSGLFIHSSRTHGVRLDSFVASKYYSKRFALARRLFDMTGSELQ
jgi:cell wall-associated NlpC family hydrolase